MQQLSLFGAAEEKKPVEIKQEEETVAPLSTEKETAENAETIDEEIEQVIQPDITPDINEEMQTVAEGMYEDDKETEYSTTLNLFFETNEAAQPNEEELLHEEEVTPIITPIKITEPIKKRGRKSHKEMDAELDLVEVPEDEILFTKQYYPISLVSKWFRVNSSLLRYWTQEFHILQPRTNKKGDRLFRPEDVKNLQVIYYLLRQRKFTIEGAKTFLKANRKAVDINMQLLQSLTKFRSFLLELKANLGA